MTSARYVDPGDEPLVAEVCGSCGSLVDQNRTAEHDEFHALLELQAQSLANRASPEVPDLQSIAPTDDSCWNCGGSGIGCCQATVMY